ncbi:MAG: uridine kinase [Deltaproteobacteria bacterium]|nr:uridine kinase [Deltaproteobacteria bacterium]
MRPLIIGMAGGTASGKSTLARGLVAELGPSGLLIGHDRYYRPLDPSETAPATAHNFDHPDSLETSLLITQLEALLRGEEVVLPRYDFASHRRAPEGDRIAPRPVLVVEGILVLAVPALREYMDYAVFVDAPDAIRLQRRVARDTTLRGRSREAVVEQYEGSVRPMHDLFVEPSRRYADLVIDGTLPVPGNMKILNDRVTHCISRGGRGCAD